MLLIYILIFVFVFLLGYQVYLANGTFGNKLIEGLENGDSTTTTSTQEYKPYNLNDPNNSLILAQQNAGNIDFLKSQVDSLVGLNQQVKDISGNVVTLQDQVNQLVAAQQQYANQMTGGEAPQVSGVV
jgi:hypothetical protein